MPTTYISLDQPAMAINDARVPFCKYAMGNTMTVDSTVTLSHIIDWVAVVAKNSPGGRLNHVVINCHGSAAYLEFGDGVWMSDINLFKKWKGLVKTIWLTSCQVARIGGYKVLDGNTFCSSMGKAAGCNVVGGTATQWAGGNYPFGKIDQYEGFALVYGPGGNVISTYMGGYFSKPFL